MNTLQPDLESMIDNLVINPNDSDLRRSVRDLWEAQYSDLFPEIVRQGVVLRASLLSLLEVL